MIDFASAPAGVFLWLRVKVTKGRAKVMKAGAKVMKERSKVMNPALKVTKGRLKVTNGRRRHHGAISLRRIASNLISKPSPDMVE